MSYLLILPHSVEDIEKDVVLPPFKHEYILLDMDPYAVKTYNVLLASVVVNAIDSERTDIVRSEEISRRCCTKRNSL